MSFNNELWRIISIETDNTIKILKNEILEDKVCASNGNSWNNSELIGLITASEYLRENSYLEQCGTYNANQSNVSICKTTNWTTINDEWFTITPIINTSNHLWMICAAG